MTIDDPIGGGSVELWAGKFPIQSPLFIQHNTETAAPDWPSISVRRVYCAYKLMQRKRFIIVI